MISWFYNLLALSLSITPIILLLLWLGPVLNKRYSARWRYILWIAVSIRLLLPVSLANYIPVSIPVPVPMASGLAPAAANGGQLSINPVGETGMSMVQILLVLYLTGISVYLAYEILAYIVFRRNLLRWGRKPTDAVIEALLKERKTELNIKRDIPVRISKKVLSPMIVGLARPILIIPAESYPPAELRMILTHELVHFKRHDIWFKLILMAATAVHWFNPVVHLMVREANKDMEKSCDDYVLKNTDAEAKKCYCNIILNLAIQNNRTEGPIFSTGISSSRDHLESRIRDIFDTTKKRRGIVALTSIAILVLMSGTMVTISSAEPLTNRPLQSELALSPVDTQNGIGNDESSPQEKGIAKLDSEASPEGAGPDISKAENSEEYTAGQPAEEQPSDGNSAEIVIVDLNQLEDALADESTDKSER
ncbi:MAG: M56 family metallopeptidase [Syntrophomonadaceae bacterium]|nr:M56 family metallopeptidase [Syntrophomonadaceae bacterium]